VKVVHVLAWLGLALAAPWTTAADAQPLQPAAATQIEARLQVASFEVALEQAVRLGTQMLERRLQTSSAANMVMLAGLARARGFRLDDYGVLFDVEFPSMRRSMVWSLQELERASTGRPQQASQSSSVKPREIYESEITEALLAAVLDASAALGVGPDEWLTVAARESVVDRRFVQGGAGVPAEPAMTVILRVKGSDLNALRIGTMTREEARKRVEVKHY
jgi:hypothetical protein